MIARGQERTSRDYKWALLSLEKFAGENEVMISQLTYSFQSRWIDSLALTSRSKEKYPINIRQIHKAIDRQYRKDSWMRQQSIHHKNLSNESLDRNVYWSDEAPVYDADKLNAINERFAIDTVITHTAPSFCELQFKNGLATWAANDEGNLMADVEEERQAMDDIHEHLLYNNHPISHWCYGHFHQSWHSAIGEILFKMLDIMEFYEIR